MVPCSFDCVQYLIGGRDEAVLDRITGAVEGVDEHADDAGEIQDDAQTREVQPQRSGRGRIQRRFLRVIVLGRKDFNWIITYVSFSEVRTV